MRIWVQSLASVGLKDLALPWAVVKVADMGSRPVLLWLWRRLPAVTDSEPGLETSICHRCRIKEHKKTSKGRKEEKKPIKETGKKQSNKKRTRAVNLPSPLGVRISTWIWGRGHKHSDHSSMCVFPNTHTHARTQLSIRAPCISQYIKTVYLRRWGVRLWDERGTLSLEYSVHGRILLPYAYIIVLRKRWKNHLIDKTQIIIVWNNNIKTM